MNRWKKLMTQICRGFTKMVLRLLVLRVALFGGYLP